MVCIAAFEGGKVSRNSLPILLMDIGSEFFPYNFFRIQPEVAGIGLVDEDDGAIGSEPGDHLCLSFHD